MGSKGICDRGQVSLKHRNMGVRGHQNTHAGRGNKGLSSHRVCLGAGAKEISHPVQPEPGSLALQSEHIHNCQRLQLTCEYYTGPSLLIEKL